MIQTPHADEHARIVHHSVTHVTQRSIVMRSLTSLSLRDLCSLTASAPASGADLLEIYRMAQTADAQYAAARAAWSAGQEKLPQGLSGLLPSATVSASTQYNDREIRSRDPATGTTTSRFNSNVASLSVTQPLYRPQNFTAYEQAKTQVVQSDAVFAQAAQDLILRVAQAYFDVLLAQDTVEFAQAQLVAIGRQLEQAKRNFEVGTATITDTHEAQSRYDLTVSREIAARTTWKSGNGCLELIIGRPAPGLSPLGPSFNPRLPEPNNMDRVGRSRRARTTCRCAASQASLEFATQEVERNRAGHRPDARCLRHLFRLGQRRRHGRASAGIDTTIWSSRRCSWRSRSTRAGSPAPACARRSPTRRRRARTWRTRGAPPSSPPARRFWA